MGNIEELAHEIQFINHRAAKILTMLISVDEPAVMHSRSEYLLGIGGLRHLFVQALMQSLSIFNQGEATPYSLDKTGYQFNIRFVDKMSVEICRTELGKVPLLKDIL